MVETKQRTWLI